MKVYINDPTNPKAPRKIVEVKLIKEYQTTILVKLPDGNIIKRKKDRDIVKEQ